MRVFDLGLINTGWDGRRTTKNSFQVSISNGIICRTTKLAFQFSPCFFLSTLTHVKLSLTYKDLVLLTLWSWSTSTAFPFKNTSTATTGEHYPYLLLILWHIYNKLPSEESFFNALVHQIRKWKLLVIMTALFIPFWSIVLVTRMNKSSTVLALTRLRLTCYWALLIYLNNFFLCKIFSGFYIWKYLKWRVPIQCDSEIDNV